MSAHRFGQGAARPHDRRPSRFRPLSLPLFVSNWTSLWRLHVVDREPGDEARLIVTLSDHEGTVVTCSDYVDYHQCDCAAFVADGFDCEHLQALVGQGVFGHLTRWGSPLTPNRGA